MTLSIEIAVTSLNLLIWPCLAACSLKLRVYVSNLMDTHTHAQSCTIVC